ncbi:MAG: sulfurtransferase TusA family protein [Acidimicrobiia bacterium]|nr:sulfurtransferase TusA family protein [Acidimicrobiia bacterium]MDH3471130.1 sulfurtransferase TusA family protein [Acidimicrobiia bacterium]
MTQDVTVAQTLDLSGLLCPLPIYKASIALKKSAAGEVVEFICTDPGSLEDFPAFARQTGHELVVAEDRGETQRFLLRRADTA